MKNWNGHSVRRTSTLCVRGAADELRRLSMILMHSLNGRAVFAVRFTSVVVLFRSRHFDAHLFGNFVCLYKNPLVPFTFANWFHSFPNYFMVSVRLWSERNWLKLRIFVFSLLLVVNSQVSMMAETQNHAHIKQEIDTTSCCSPAPSSGTFSNNSQAFLFNNTPAIAVSVARIQIPIAI